MAKKETKINVHKNPKELNFYKLYLDEVNILYLTFEELGLLHYLLSKPKEWNFTQENILKERNEKYNVLAVKELSRLLKNLRTFGFVKTTSFKTKAPGFTWRTQVTNIPYDPNVFTKSEIKSLQKERAIELKKRQNKNRFNTHKKAVESIENVTKEDEFQQ